MLVVAVLVSDESLPRHREVCRKLRFKVQECLTKADDHEVVAVDHDSVDDEHAEREHADPVDAIPAGQP